MLNESFWGKNLQILPVTADSSFFFGVLSPKKVCIISKKLLLLHSLHFNALSSVFGRCVRFEGGKIVFLS